MTTPEPRAEVDIDVVDHHALTPADRGALRRLFDAEYLASHGEWDPEQPYGYAPHDVHVLARSGDVVVGHVGWGRRRIRVGGAAVMIAGVGGMLVADAARGSGLGARLLDCAAASMATDGGIAFGYLGCREAVVPFYAACGWNRIAAAERSLDRRGEQVDAPPGQPLMVLPADAALQAWPDGPIDLRGRAW